MTHDRPYLKRSDESNDQWLRRVGTVRVNKNGDYEEVVAKKETTMTNFNPELSMIIAKGAPTNFVDCVTKDLVTGDPYQLTIAAAKAAHPELIEARAFAKFVEANPILQKYAFTPVAPFSYLQNELLTKVGPVHGPVAVITGASLHRRRGRQPRP